MVSMEMAMEFEQQGFEVVFLCYQNSVVYQKIKDKIKKTEVLNYEENLFSKIIKLRKVIKRNSPDKLVINRLPSLKYVVPALIGQSKIDLFCISHMLVNYHKKDPYHFILYKRVKKIIVLTEIQKENHLAFLPVDENQLAVIPDWVSFPSEKLNEKIYLNSFFKKEFSNYPIMVMASRLDPQKGQDLAIQALKIAIEKDRPFLLVIIGDNTIGEKNVKIELKSMVEKLKLTEYVHFHGFVENIFPYLRAAHAVLIPSYEETFGRVVIESMAVGTPVIASRSGGIPNLIKDQEDGIFHGKKDSNDLELKIYHLMQTPQLHKKISDNSKTTAKQYSKEIIFQKIKDLIFS